MTMKNPWQIWLLYAIGLAIVIPAMVWLSVQTIELDQYRERDLEQTELARREVELQERIGSALWRMDWMLTPLVAQEAARPYYLYQSFYPVAGGAEPFDKTPSGSGTPRRQQASPLLFQPTEYVVLHFQIDPENQISSPQRPRGEQRVQAITSGGLTQADVDATDSKLSEIALLCSYDQLFLKCPSLKLPSAQRSEHRQADVQFEQLANLDADQNDPSIPAQQAAPVQEPEPQRENPQQASAVDDALPVTAQAQTMYIDPQIAQQLVAQEQQLLGSFNDNPATQLPISKSEVQRSRNVSRGTQEYAQRRKSAETYALNQWIANNRLDMPWATDWGATTFVREGVMRPLWVGDKLILARRVETNDREVIQCCWLNWEKISQALAQEVADILPDARFEPIHDPQRIKLGRALATLPVQLVVNTSEMLSTLELSSDTALRPNQPSGLRMSLAIAWGCLLLAAIAGALVLGGLMRLSERRGAFVSAVTHELRTPLTTFRMYAEMLAENMVPSAEKRQKYAETLKIEAERLSHLVENVLQFARIERGRGKTRRESITVGQMFERFSARLSARAEQAGMCLVDELPEAVAKQILHTDPAAIEQILFNLVDNACKYARSASDRRIELGGELTPTRIRMYVSDHGPGIAAADRRRMFLPFSKSDQDAADTVQGVGLGLALCRRMARSLGGSLQLVESTSGARFVLELPLR